MVNYIRDIKLNPPDNTQQLFCFDGISKNDGKNRTSFAIVEGENIMKLSKKSKESYEDYITKLRTISAELDNFAQFLLEEHVI